MAWFKRNKPDEVRTETIADRNDILRIRGTAAEYKEWSLKKAVKEGFKASGWVFRAVTITKDNASSVPWSVYDKDGEPVENHHLTKVLKKPNPSFSSQDTFELIIAWLELGGEGFLLKNKIVGETKELWLYSPDRMSAVVSKEPGKLIDHWLFDEKRNNVLSTDDVIHFKYLDPANPIRGISPLQAAARIVDVDNEQQDWNKEAMQNRGVLDGFFSFKTDINESQFNTYRAKIREMFSGKKNARGYGVVGSQATYQHIGMSPAEMDFLETRKNNRDEIFTIFGIPLPLVASDTMTYSNYQAALRILWESKLIPLLNLVKDTLNTSLSDELQDGFYIDFDKSKVSALKQDLETATKAASELFKMGVPVKNLNARFNLGVEEFPGWDLSFSGRTAATNNGERSTNPETRSDMPFVMREIRASDAYIEREKVADQRLAPDIRAFLSEQQESVFNALDKGKDPRDAIDEGSVAFAELLEARARDLVIDFAANTLTVKRGSNVSSEIRSIVEDQLEVQVDSLLRDEQFYLIEAGHVSTATAEMVMNQVRQGVIDGASIQQVKDAIQDVGAFSPERALRIARTASGTMQSVGQMAAGITLGATRKTWNTSGFSVRDRHVEREGETVDIESDFSGGIRFPCDPRADAGDRINCRCSLTFE